MSTCPSWLHTWYKAHNVAPPIFSWNMPEHLIQKRMDEAKALGLSNDRYFASLEVIRRDLSFKTLDTIMQEGYDTRERWRPCWETGTCTV